MTHPSITFVCPTCGDIKEMLIEHVREGDSFVCHCCKCIYHAPKGFTLKHPQVLRDNLLVTTMIKQGVRK